MSFQYLGDRFSRFARHFMMLAVLLVTVLAVSTAKDSLGADNPATRTADKKIAQPAHPWRQGRGRLTAPGRAASTRSRATGASTTPEVKLKKGMALLNFSDAMIKDVVMTISRITGKNFILSPEVLGRKISIRTTKPIKKKDVFGIFETILSVNGLTAVRGRNYYTIVPSKSAKQRGLALYSGKNLGKIPPGDSMINVLVPIEFISANDVATILKSNISPGGNIAVYPKGNTLIITETASNARKFLALIKRLDVDLFKKFNVSIVNINNVDVTTMAKELIEIFKVLGYGKETGQFYTIPIERFNSLILFSSSKEILNSAKEWIGQLDKESSTNEISTHIYYVKNDKASNIKDLLDKLYGTADTGETAPTDAAAGDTTAADQTGAQKTTAPATTTAAPPVYASPTGGDKAIDIMIYEPSNAIIVRSSEMDYQNILETIQELDRAPKQVLIDALVIEVALDESTKYGIQWSAITGNVGIQNNTGLFSTTLDSPNSSISTPIGLAAVGGLNVLATDTKNFFGFLQAFASKGKVNVLSNPHILVQNYAKASISVGSDEPIATQSTQTAVTTTASLIQSIEYRRTGIILTVTPQITEGGLVAMSLHQEISDVSTSRTVGDGTFPSFTNREAETSVVIQDGQTIAIGGLIDTKENKIHSGIPLLSRIPFLGELFKFTTLTNDRTELVILLTPRVISNSDDALAATGELEFKLQSLKKLIEDSKKPPAGEEEK